MYRKFSSAISRYNILNFPKFDLNDLLKLHSLIWLLFNFNVSTEIK